MWLVAELRTRWIDDGRVMAELCRWIADTGAGMRAFLACF